jgi:predicted MPP superfamily phosphohydrolase
LYFIVFSILVLVMQFLHWDLLIQVLPDRCRRWIPWGLAVAHLPLVAFMILRVTGHAGEGMGSVLGPLARVALYFQLFTVVNLVFWGLALGIWKVRRRMGHSIDRGPEDPGRRAFLRKTAAGGIGIMAAASASGADEAYGDPEVTRTVLWFADLPMGLDGLRIVQLADLHCGPLVGESLVKRWRLLAERENPDLVVITGDLVDSLPGEIEPFVDAFQGFQAPLGRFAILGNHDYFTDPRPIWRGLEQAGFTCLENRHEVVRRRDAEMAILGLQDPMARNGRFRSLRFGPGPMPQDVLVRLPREPWRLCLCHRPSNWDLARETGARLTLSGHTHGGQVNLIPGFSTAQVLGPYTSGLYRYQGQVLYVSRGLGVVGLPMRIGASPEIAVLTLRRKEIPSMHPAEPLIP